MTVAVMVSPAKQKEFLQTVRSLKGGVEKQEGLRKATSRQGADDETSFTLVYLWESQADLDRYLATENHRVLLGALRVLGEQSEIRYREVRSIKRHVA